MPTEKKKQKIEGLKERVKGKDVFFADYRGLTVFELGDLRAKLRPLSVDFNIVKNTLMQIAAKDLGLNDILSYLEGPTAIAVGDQDPVQTSKVLVDYMKDHKTFEMKGALVEGKIVGADQLKALAALPPKEVLMAQLLGTMNAPIGNFVRVIAAPVQGLVTVLDRIKEQKSAA